MASEFNFLLLLACPPAVLPDLKVWMRDNCSVPIEEFDLAIHLGVEGAAYEDAAFLFGSLLCKPSWIELLRPEVSPEGELYSLGVRARRFIFQPLEVPLPAVEQGKLSVNVIDAGTDVPNPADWNITRVTLDKFLEELGIQYGLSLTPPVLNHPPLVQLAPPEPSI